MLLWHTFSSYYVMASEYTHIFSSIFPWTLWGRLMETLLWVRRFWFTEVKFRLMPKAFTWPLFFCRLDCLISHQLCVYVTVLRHSYTLPSCTWMPYPEAYSFHVAILFFKQIFFFRFSPNSDVILCVFWNIATIKKDLNICSKTEFLIGVWHLKSVKV